MAGLSTLRTHWKLTLVAALLGSGVLVRALRVLQSKGRNSNSNRNRTEGGSRDGDKEKEKENSKEKGKGKGKGRKHVAVDGRFFHDFGVLFRIIVPGFFTSECFHILLVAAMMVLRTLCDLWMISNGTAIERSIITRDKASFIKYFFRFVYAMLPISLVNNLLKYGLWQLVVLFRARLTSHIYKEYMKGFIFYQVANIDSRIDNADQLLTQDVDKFCQSVSDLYSNLSKPLLDIVIYARRLSEAVGIHGPASLMVYMVSSGFLLTKLRGPLGRYTITEQRLEGEFRYATSRLTTHGEEIAFYGGNLREKETVSNRFQTLFDHIQKVLQFRFTVGVVDTIIAKYCATAVGYMAVSYPFINLDHPRHLKSTHGELMQDYYSSARMLISMATAIGRLVLSGRELNRLTGFTARVTELLAVISDLNQNRYERLMQHTDPSSQLKPFSGKVITKDHVIKFENVPIVTPNGDMILPPVSFEIQSGMNLLVVGPNGCGKSSLFRILGELWPCFGGTITKPAGANIFYIPQKPYLVLGSLRDQVIYPDRYEDMVRKGVTDDDLLHILDKVSLGYLVTREGGWGAVATWADVLSGGEKQRVAMARMFYHKPQFAILDECTSAVSVDVEGKMYQYGREAGITLVTVSLRKALWRYHDYVLRITDDSQYEFRKIESHETDS
eukprot:TRINITY_DN787_c0_g2_i1.p1 TRINITY_DN787_c0_g2~~TRINITY_DN787_c0_g2_i1.p1  ORF type:complete len:670 (-),score=139.49 TRINITY_DN787_c0_g2_i1:443-2452(-)